MDAWGTRPDDMIDLWATRDGRRCRLTREVCGPPFHVIVMRGADTLISGTFGTHDDAARFAIREMSAGERSEPTST